MHMVHMVHPLAQQAEGLFHVVCRSHSIACVSTRLLQETKSILRGHHLPADSTQTPGGETITQFNSQVTNCGPSAGSLTFSNSY